jgi:hypothetical protein
VPCGACYSEHCDHEAVWVMREGVEGLAQFILVLQDIATLMVAPTDGSRPANITPPVLVTLWEVQRTPLGAGVELPNQQGLIYRDDRVIKPGRASDVQGKIEYALSQNKPVTVAIEMDDWMNTYTTPYQGDRTAVKPGANVTKAIPGERTFQGERRIGPPSSVLHSVDRVINESEPERIPIPDPPTPMPDKKPG